MNRPIRVRGGQVFEHDGWRYYDPDPVKPKPEPTWWQQNWRGVMNWAVAIPCAGFVGPVLHPDFASSPAWRWMTGLGLLFLVAAWVFEPKHRPR